MSIIKRVGILKYINPGTSGDGMRLQTSRAVPVLGIYQDGGKRMIQRMKKAMIAGLVVLGVFLAAVPAQAAIQATDLEIRGQAANETAGVQDYLDISSGTVSWYPRNFAGFFYELNDEPGSEGLTILDSASLIGTRTISLDKLVYSTSGDNRILNVVKYPFNGNYTAAAQAGLSGFQAGGMSSEDGKYKAAGWQGEKFIAIKNKTNKLSKPVIEHNASRYDRKALTTGETWDIGAGWQLTAQAIDAKASPRIVWFVLSKDGIKKDEKILSPGQIYTYVEKNLAGEVDVPVLVTYIDSIFAGATSDMVLLKYTWAIDTNVMEVRTGDNFGILTTTKADESVIELRNSRFPLTLARDSIVNLVGNLKFRVANIDTLRFYPIIQVPEGIHEVRGRTANETEGPKGNLDLSSGIVSWQPQNFAGLFYDLNDGFGNENLTIFDSASLIETRTILQDKLKYSTSSDNKMMNVVRYPFNGNYTAAQEAGLREFQAGSMSSEDGKYRIIGWQGERYVAVKNKTSKLARLVIEQGSGVYSKKTLQVGETWDIGRGWNLTVMGVDARASPRQVWVVLNKDGIKKDDKVLIAGGIYTYVETNFAGELNVPLFVTYVDSIFAGATTDIAQFRYTWAIDTDVTEVREGDLFGVFRVTGINSSAIELRNTDTQISLNRDSTVNLMGSMGLRVADSDTLRFYPKVDYEVTSTQVPTCQYSMISGHMFEDNNVDGLQDAYEPGMANRTVRLEGTDICSNVAVSMDIRTDAEGYYEFRNIRTGTYFLSEEIPPLWIPTTPGIYKVI
ncbi:MAG: hypothetical protein FIB08_14815, partial [Candidatus Methanoperedens sp.]|nr:hypothetical protein [Candidatus Methanoperedens sp.]